ncbi:MAG: T9SS type A sorting domain-containing protein [FCB group bacterium]|nr:T9SS type A sorting domain-containing protein [FCB group bacterium]
MSFRILLSIAVVLTVLQSIGTAQSWVHLGLSGEKVYGITMAESVPGKLICGTRSTYSSSGSHYGGIYHLDLVDSGIDTFYQNISVVDFASLPSNSNNIYAALHVQAFCSPGILKSTDGGRTWNWKNLGLYIDGETGVDQIEINPRNPLCIFTSTSGNHGGKAYRTLSAGNTWVELDNSQETGIWDSNVTGWAINPLDSAIVYSGCTGVGMIFKSVDNGDSWNRVFSGAGYPGPCEGMAINPQYPSTVYALFSGSGVYTSDDGGQSWSWSNDGLNDLHVRDILIHPTFTDSIFLATTAGVYISGDGGSNWTEMNEGLDTLLVETLFFDPEHNNLYCGTHDGVYGLGDQLSVNYRQTILPSDWGIERIYPNPFNSEVTIIVQTSKSRVVQIELISILGSVVVMDQSYSLYPGRNEVRINAKTKGIQSFSSGTYLVRIGTGTEQMSRKVVLIK